MFKAFFSKFILLGTSIFLLSNNLAYSKISDSELKEFLKESGIVFGQSKLLFYGTLKELKTEIFSGYVVHTPPKPSTTLSDVEGYWIPTSIEGIIQTPETEPPSCFRGFSGGYLFRDGTVRKLMGSQSDTYLMEHEDGLLRYTVSLKFHVTMYCSLLTDQYLLCGEFASDSRSEDFYYYRRASAPCADRKD